MSAIVLAPPRTEAEAVGRGKAALAAVRSDAFPWPSADATTVSGYADWLRDDLETLDDLLTGRRHPATEFPELAAGWPDDALGQAVERVVQDIEAGTGALIERVRRYCGDQGAEFVLAAAAQAGQQEGEGQ